MIRARKPIKCVICKKPYHPEPDERNVKTHPGHCRYELDKQRWARADARKRQRKLAIRKEKAQQARQARQALRLLQGRVKTNEK